MEKLALSWEAAHFAYYQAMDFKDKIYTREGTSSQSSIFWAMFEDFCEEIATHPYSDPELLNIYTNLMERKKLRRGISISESSISKIVQHQSMCMYNETEFKIEFELQARQL